MIKTSHFRWVIASLEFGMVSNLDRQCLTYFLHQKFDGIVSILADLFQQSPQMNQKLLSYFFWTLFGSSLIRILFSLKIQENKSAIHISLWSRSTRNWNDERLVWLVVGRLGSTNQSAVCKHLNFTQNLSASRQKIFSMSRPLLVEREIMTLVISR